MNSSRTPCPFSDCVSCGPGQPHFCRLCKKYNDHRSANCPTRPCTLNCGFCTGTQAHQCRKCKKYNDHRTMDCLQNAATPIVVKVPKRAQPVASSITMATAAPPFVPKRAQPVASSSAVATAAPPSVTRYVSDRIPVMPIMNNRATNVSINVCYVIIGGKVFVAIHGCALRTGKFMCAGGGVNRGQSREEAACAENKEEHGYTGNASPRYVGTSENINNGKTSHYHHYVSEVDPIDYSSGSITTPQEIVMNPNCVPAQFGPSNCIKSGNPRDGRMPIHFVELSALLAQENKNIVYGQFRSAVIEMSKLGVFSNNHSWRF